MSHRISLAIVALVACLAWSLPTAEARGSFSKTGRSGQVYTWAAGHC